MIDVHVLTHEGTKPEWLDECLKSLANEPCTVHVLDNTGCTVGQGRAKGYRLGFHPFVTYVDSDDHVFPGVMAAVCDALQTHDSVCTAEVAMLDGVEFFKNRDRSVLEKAKGLERELDRDVCDYFDQQKGPGVQATMEL